MHIGVVIVMIEEILLVIFLSSWVHQSLGLVRSNQLLRYLHVKLNILQVQCCMSGYLA